MEKLVWLTAISLGLVCCAPDLSRTECFRSTDCQEGQICNEGICIAGISDMGSQDPLTDGQAEGDAPVSNRSGYSGAEAIFVDPESGDDRALGSHAQPVATLQRAVELLDLDHDVIVAAGGEYVLSQTLVFSEADRLVISGCHKPEEAWVQRDEGPCTLITGANPVFTLKNIDDAALIQVELQATDGRSGSDGLPDGPFDWGVLAETSLVEAMAGENSVGLDVHSSEVSLERSIVRAGRGGDGGDGRHGRHGAPGNEGEDGENGRACSEDCTAPTGGAPGEEPTCYTNWDSEPMAGGAGGEGGTSDDIGTAHAGHPAPGGAAGGLQGDRVDPNGEDGADAIPLTLSHGLCGGPFGYIRRYQWHPHAGIAAGDGLNGDGGGGGAGSLGGEANAFGPGGGGGGSGGCGGEGGGGGAGGGGSIAVMLVNSILHLDDSEIYAGQGGNGGHGGRAGSGGSGGEGGAPGQRGDGSTPVQGWGGAGGGGGPGSIGGGGPGGGSFAVLAVANPNELSEDAVLRYTPDDSIVSEGSGGAGGQGGTDSIHLDYWGPTGAAMELFYLPIDIGYGGELCPHDYALVEVALSDGESTSSYEICVARFEASTRLFPGVEPAWDELALQAFSLPGEIPAADVPILQAYTTCLHGTAILCVDVMLQQSCDEGQDTVAPSDCNFSGRLQDTGSYEMCQTSSGIYDLLGNVGEWVIPTEADDEPGQLFSFGGVFGGSFRTSLSENPSCDYIEGAQLGERFDSVGFRCCTAPEALDMIEYRPVEEEEHE